MAWYRCVILIVVTIKDETSKENSWNQCKSYWPPLVSQFFNWISGAVGLVLFGALNAGILYVYFSAFQAVDEEEFGGAWELTKEGFMTSFATFMVIWIILYTGLHFD